MLGGRCLALGADDSSQADRFGTTGVFLYRPGPVLGPLPEFGSSYRGLRPNEDVLRLLPIAVAPGGLCLDAAFPPDRGGVERLQISRNIGARLNFGLSWGFGTSESRPLNATSLLREQLGTMSESMWGNRSGPFLFITGDVRWKNDWWMHAGIGTGRTPGGFGLTLRALLTYDFPMFRRKRILR
jgi:hypothetical protein